MTEQINKWCPEMQKIRAISLEDCSSVLWKLMKNDNGSLLVEEQLHMKDLISLQRFEIPCRGLLCDHLLCFDYSVYMHHNKNRPMMSDYKCPICNRSCILSKVYIDSIHYSLLHASCVGDSIFLDADGSLRYVSKQSTKSVISLDGSFQFDAHTTKLNSTISPFCSLKDLMSRGVLPPNFDSVRLTELCKVTLNDVLQLINSPTDSDKLLGEIPFVKSKGVSMLLQLTECRPFMCSSFQGLQHSLQMANGVGPFRAVKVIDCLVCHLEASFASLKCPLNHLPVSKPESMLEVATSNSTSTCGSVVSSSSGIVSHHAQPSVLIDLTTSDVEPKCSILGPSADISMTMSTVASARVVQHLENSSSEMHNVHCVSTNKSFTAKPLNIEQKRKSSVVVDEEDHDSRDTHHLRNMNHKNDDPFLVQSISYKNLSQYNPSHQQKQRLQHRKKQQNHHQKALPHQPMSSSLASLLVDDFVEE